MGGPKMKVEFETDVPTAVPSPSSSAASAPVGLEFPGCRPIRLGREELKTWEGRLEYWDGDTETAWVVREPTSPAHERPSQCLAGLGFAIASVRGSPIEYFGAMDLELRDEDGGKWRIMQADQSLYLYPGRVRLPSGSGLVIGEDDFPDVVVEVDHTTDVRRGKLRLYESWGFPEVWVEVPDTYTPSRRPGVRPGTTIHVLEEGAYQSVPESRAFPSWSAAEIHAAMNESTLSAETSRVLARVGRALGAREGTGPDDMTWLREQRAEGRSKGWVEGRLATLRTVVQRTLAARGIAAPDAPLDARDITGVTDEEVMDTLFACDDLGDFRTRLRALRR